jgi:hypothetical protein
MLANQRQELLREGIPRHRPEPGPGASGENNWNDLGHAGALFQKPLAIARLAPAPRINLLPQSQG